MSNIKRLVEDLDIESDEDYWSSQLPASVYRSGYLSEKRKQEIREAVARVQGRTLEKGN